MADCLMTLVDELNLKEVLPLATEVWGLEARGRGAGGCSLPIASNRLIPVMSTPK